MRIDKSPLINQAFSGRLNQIQKSIDGLIQLVNEREQIKNKVLTELDNQILKAENMILEKTPTNHYQKIQQASEILDCQREIFHLEKAIIDENTTSWRDTLLLKKELIQLVNELSSMKYRIDFMNDIHET